MAACIGRPSTAASRAGGRPSTGSTAGLRPSTAARKNADATDDIGQNILPYAEPLRENNDEIAGPMIDVFGESVARAAFSKDWELRMQALESMTVEVGFEFYMF